MCIDTYHCTFMKGNALNGTGTISSSLIDYSISISAIGLLSFIPNKETIAAYLLQQFSRGS